MSAGRLFYGRHTAQHPAAALVNNDKSCEKTGISHMRKQRRRSAAQ